MSGASGRVVAHSWLLCVFLSCSHPPQAEPEPERETETNPCPAGARLDAERARRLEARLVGTEAERYLGVSYETCFGPDLPAVVTDERVVLLPGASDDDDLAARLGHLLEHVVSGTLPDTGPCEQRVREALRKEASAYALEIRLRDRFELGAASFSEIEAAYRADGADGIFAWLVAHPEGGPGVDALGRSYRERCEALEGNER